VSTALIVACVVFASAAFGSAVATLTATATSTAMPTRTAQPEPTLTPSVAVPPTPSPTVPLALTSTPTVIAAPICCGDCDGSGEVTVDEVITSVNRVLFGCL
jgi:hypothetical protein